MDSIYIKSLTFISTIDGDTITVSIYGDTKYIGERKFGAITFTIKSAEKSIMFGFEHFGLFLDSKMYKKELEKEPEKEPVKSESISPKSPEKRPNLETDLSSTKIVNMEESETVSTITKKDIKETTEKNDKVVQDAKPKIIIKIPKPFGLGYIIIDLSKMLGDIFKGLAVGIGALLLSKIVSSLSKLLQDKLSKGGVSQNDINDALDVTDINGLIKESELEFNNLTLLNSNIDINKSVENPPDEKNRKKKKNKYKYSIDRRNREDILDSNIVKTRDGDVTNNKLMKNPNYGIYVD